MMIFSHSGSLHTIHITTKTKASLMRKLINEGWIAPDDPLCPIIEAFINHIKVGELRIRNRLRVVFSP